LRADAFVKTDGGKSFLLNHLTKKRGKRIAFSVLVKLCGLVHHVKNILIMAKINFTALLVVKTTEATWQLWARLHKWWKI